MEKIRIVARHIEITKGITDYVEKRLGHHIEKYLHNIVSAQVILEVEKYRHIVEVVLHTSNKKVFRLKEVDENLYTAIDKIADRLKDTLIRFKEKMVLSRKHRKKVSEIFVSQEEPKYEIETEYVPIFEPQQALQQYSLSDKDYLIFINKQTDNICMVKNTSNGIKIVEFKPLKQ